MTSHQVVKQPQVVLSHASAALAVRYLGVFLGFVGLNSQENWVSTHTAVLIAVVYAVFDGITTVTAALRARSKVTPNKSPRANDGVELIRADSAVLRPVVVPDYPSASLYPPVEAPQGSDTETDDDAYVAEPMDDDV